MRMSLIACLVLAGCSAPITGTPADYRLENGYWFDGETFTQQSVSIADGALRFDSGNSEAAQIVDLEGGYVIPPLCEAHNHNLGDSADDGEIDPMIQAYLDDGVYYVMIQGSFAVYRDYIAERINHPGSIDIAFANNGLTGSGGHPRRLRETLMERFGNYPEFTKDTLPDAGYFEADDLETMREKWALIQAENPDFIKVMLYHSDQYEQRKDDAIYYGQRGLNPALLPELVDWAHAANLRVSVHVESDADMKTALESGVDIIAHLPSNDSTETLSDETIALAVDSGAAIITTLSVARRYDGEPDRYDAILQAQRDNLVRLSEAGANLVLGSDSVWDTSHREAAHLVELGVLDNRQLLTMWTQACAKTVFPDRDIGRLAEGYEASFLVLDGDPLTDFIATQRIAMRFKDARPLPRIEAAED